MKNILILILKIWFIVPLISKDMNLKYIQNLKSQLQLVYNDEIIGGLEKLIPDNMYTEDIKSKVEFLISLDSKDRLLDRKLEIISGENKRLNDAYNKINLKKERFTLLSNLKKDINDLNRYSKVKNYK